MVTVVLAMAAISATAQEPVSLRGELLEFIDDLEQVPGGAAERLYEGKIDLQVARGQIESMSESDLGVLQDLFGHTRYWREVPGVLEMIGVSSQGGMPLGAPGLAHPSAALLDLEPGAFRETVVGMAKALQEIEAQRPGSLRLDVDRVLAGLDEIDDSQLADVMQGLAPYADQWSEGDVVDHQVIGITSGIGGCGGSFPSKQVCEITFLFNEVVFFFDVTLPGFFTETLPDFFVDVWNRAVAELTRLFQLAIDQIPTGQELADFLEITAPGWYNSVAGVLPSELPCPAIGTEIPGIGEVGTFEGFWTCKRGVEFLLRVPWKISSKDSWSLPVRVALGLFYFPTKYLCGCYESQALVPFWEGQLAHVDETTGNLDVDLSTRASQSDLDLLHSQIFVLDGASDDVSDLALGAEGQVDQLLGSSAGQAAELVELEELRLRSRIAEDLLQGGPSFVGLFQLPEAHGGFLELAFAVTAEQIAAAEAAGGDVRKAEEHFADAESLGAASRYKSAYAELSRAFHDALKEMDD